MRTNLLKPHEVARIFGVSIKTLQRWEQKGYLTSIRTLGNHRRWRAEDVKKLLEKGKSDESQS